MSTRTMQMLACLILVAVVVTLVLGVAGCGRKKTAEEKELMKDPAAKAAKQKEMMKGAKEQQREERGKSAPPGK